MGRSMLGTLLMVALGGAVGSVVRFLTVLAAARIAPGFPFGTLTVNLLGSVLMGVFYIVLTGPRAGLPPLLMVGVLGGFTTFSSFALDALKLWEGGMAGLAALYVLASVGLSLAGVAAGVMLARAFA